MLRFQVGLVVTAELRTQRFFNSRANSMGVDVSFVRVVQEQPDLETGFAQRYLDAFSLSLLN